MATNNSINTYIVPTANNEVTMPSQPAFLFHNSVTDANQTGNGAVATVDFDTEIFDQGGDFAADTFTAPVTGQYYLDTSVGIDAVNGAMTQCQLRIVTSNRSYITSIINPATCREPTFDFQVHSSVLTDMDAADTATITIALFNGPGNISGILGGAFETVFSGKLQV